MTVSNTPKTAAFSSTNVSKANTSWFPFIKAGYGWDYDQAGIAYDGPLDPVTGLPLYYDSEGTLPTWANITKHNA